MAFLFDSLCALTLLFSAILSWWMAVDTRPVSRIHLRFAAAMLAVLSAAEVLPSSDLARDVALLLPGLAAAGVVLALSFPRQPPLWLACLILIVGLLDGLLASLERLPVLALSYQVGIALVLFTWGLSRFGEEPRAALPASLCAASLLFGAMAVMNASLGAAMLFYAAFLLLATRASQAAVADKRRRGSLFVSLERA